MIFKLYVTFSDFRYFFTFINIEAVKIHWIYSPLEENCFKKTFKYLLGNKDLTEKKKDYLRINHILNECAKSENTESSLKYWNTIQLEILPSPEDKVIEYLMKNSMGSNIKITVLVPRLASKDLGNHHAHPHKKRSLIKMKVYSFS